jgi:hypothetical protein
VNDTLEYWIVEQYVDLGNEKFWHEKASLLRRPKETSEAMSQKAHHVGSRDVKAYGGRYRIRVYKEETWYDSGEVK